MNIRNRLNKLESVSIVGKPLEQWTDEELEDYIAKSIGYEKGREITNETLLKIIRGEEAEA